MDNASNNDTLIEAFEKKCKAANIDFSATDARIRCMPHTVHPAALKVRSSDAGALPIPSTNMFAFLQLLQAIGVITKKERKKAEGRAGASYQETVLLSLSREEDDNAVLLEDQEEDAEDAATPAVTPLQAVKKAGLKPSIATQLTNALVVS